MIRARTLWLLVLTAVAPVCRAQAEAEPASISADTAIHRIGSVLAAAEPGEEQLSVLVEIAERCEDPGLGALAAFNAGTLALQLQDPRAADLLRDAERGSSDAALRASARFNLGHALMPRADTAPADTGEIDERIASLRQAARLFRSVLEIQPENRDAAANTERVRRMIRDLMKERERMEAEQQARDELAEQLEQLADQQEQQAADSQQQAERGEASKESDGSEQRALNEQTEQADRQAEQAGAGEEARQSIEEARQAQQRAEEAIDRGDSQAAAEHQRQAADALKRAAEQLRKDGQESGGEDGQGGDKQEGATPEQPEPAPDAQAGADGETGPQIDPLAEALLDKERREREQRGQYLQRGRPQQVERDW